MEREEMKIKAEEFKKMFQNSGLYDSTWKYLPGIQCNGENPPVGLSHMAAQVVKCTALGTY